MNFIPTPHIELSDANKMAETVLMPGDPLRAKYITENFLSGIERVNGVRNMLGYTGTYNDKKVTVFGSGMGMPSIGIYSYELYKFYGVENIIRIGSAGAYTDTLKLYDLVLATGAWSESSYAKTQNKSIDTDILYPSDDLNRKIIKSAEQLGCDLTLGMIHSSDVFYRERPDEFVDIHQKYGCLAVEMESFALFHNANILGKKASCLLTISDSLVTHEATTSDERQNSFLKMIDVALGAL